MRALHSLSNRRWCWERCQHAALFSPIRLLTRVVLSDPSALENLRMYAFGPRAVPRLPCGRAQVIGATPTGQQSAWHAQRSLRSSIGQNPRVKDAQSRAPISSTPCRPPQRSVPGDFRFVPSLRQTPSTGKALRMPPTSRGRAIEHFLGQRFARTRLVRTCSSRTRHLRRTRMSGRLLLLPELDKE